MLNSTEPFAEYASATRGQIDDALDRWTQFESGCPANLAEVIRYSLLAGGKRLRPLLVVMAAEACGGSAEAALPAAAAVEMIHTYSLLHDDLPAMDDDDLRHGRPTAHKVYGEAMAILAGDALLTRAFEVVAEQIEPRETAARCCAVLARAAGACGMVGGQVDDVCHDPSATARASAEEQLAKLESIHERKTGAMLNVSLELGALVAGADRDDRDALDEYGRRLGLAFQITDDLLDVSGSQEALGKRVGKDDQHGKLTFPGLLGMERSQSRAEELISEACLAVARFGPRAHRLEALAHYVLERDR